MFLNHFEMLSMPLYVTLSMPLYVTLILLHQNKRESCQRKGKGKESRSSKRAYKLSKLLNDAVHTHYESLSRLKINPILLSFVDEFNDSYVPLYEKGALPKPLSLLFEDKKFATFSDLLIRFEQVYQDATVTAAQVKMVEEKTRDQSRFKL